MKAITIFLAVVFTLRVFSLFASGTDTKPGPGCAPANYVESNILAPVTPAEATFEDTDVPFVIPVVEGLAPITPADATFEDNIDETTLSPSTPAAADFEDLP